MVQDVVTTPSIKGNGRNKDGTFKKGEYKGGPGNPWVALTHKLKAAIQKAGEDKHPKTQRTRMEELAVQLWEMALDPLGDQTAVAKRWAMQQIIDRFLGKPKESIKIEGNLTFTDALAMIRKDYVRVPGRG